MEYNRTKIVATIGPSTQSKENLNKIIQAGVNVCRINFSHGGHEEYAQVIRNIREINEEQDKSVAILADLQGPKIRIGELEKERITLKDGDKITLSSEDIMGNESMLGLNYPAFAKDVKEGERVLIDDGKIVLKVLKSDGAKLVECLIVSGGPLTSKKGVNLPNTTLRLPSMTEKDKKDLDFALSQDVEWVALSFVRSARDIIELKHIINASNGKARVIAKIEKPEAVKFIDDIVAESDAIMVARGDLGVEIPMEEVPILQKKLVKKALRYSKPVIIATQMMESMITHYVPTRAEVNDVANAVMDGADAVMLSAETSVGKYPIHVVENMSKIIREVERSAEIFNYEFPPMDDEERFISDSICYTATKIAQRVNAKAIVTMTQSGYTAYKIASFRPEARIFIFSGNKDILNQLSLVWGVQAYHYDKFVSTDHTIADIKFILKHKGVVASKDLIINVASMPIKDKGQTNMLKLSAID
ncbi:MAG TPA: pyruvate kinase [Flavobacteriales bacterium]|nr:pyruvate kinase [Flavobacteriales bacterium]